MSLLRTLTPDTFRSFIERLVLYAGESGLSQTTEQIQQKLHKLGFHAQSLNDAAQKFSGWVWDKIVARLGTFPGVFISESEFHAALCHIRDEFTSSNLPARYHELELDDSELAGQTNRIYVRQLELVGASPSTKHRSILAYFRAVRERNTWLYQGEILPDRLRQYDRELIERWESEFEAMCCRIMNWADLDELRQKGLGHFQEIERIEVPIQTGWIYRYLTWGSYHALADELKVGWHPAFRSQILPSQPLTAKGNTP